jgi:probable addiction module antidote protein
MPKRTRPYRDSLLADLQDPHEAAGYLNAALEDSDKMFLVALRDVAEAKQLAKVAEKAGIARESIYHTLTRKGNPTYSTLLGILRAVGLRLAVVMETSQEPKASRKRKQPSMVGRVKLSR